MTIVLVRSVISPNKFWRVFPLEDSQPKISENAETLVKTTVLSWLTWGSEKRTEYFFRQWFLLEISAWNALPMFLILFTRVQSLAFNNFSSFGSYRCTWTVNQWIDQQFCTASNTTLEDDNNGVQERRSPSRWLRYLARRWHFIPAEEEQLEEELTQLLRRGRMGNCDQWSCSMAFGEEAKYYGHRSHSNWSIKLVRVRR